MKEHSELKAHNGTAEELSEFQQWKLFKKSQKVGEAKAPQDENEQEPEEVPAIDELIDNTADEPSPNPWRYHTVDPKSMLASRAGAETTGLVDTRFADKIYQGPGREVGKVLTTYLNAYRDGKLDSWEDLYEFQVALHSTFWRSELGGCTYVINLNVPIKRQRATDRVEMHMSVQLTPSEALAAKKAHQAIRVMGGTTTADALNQQLFH
jgi:hypothetical protein